MGRPLKKGLNYFNIDCIQEDNLNYIEAKHGIMGYGVVIKLWRKIYMVEGYYTEWNNKNVYLFAREIGVDVGQITEVVDSCFQEGIFNRSMFDRYQILTSRGIQRRYIKIVTEAKRKDTEIDEKFRLIDLNPELNEFPPEETPKPPEESAQKKLKKTNKKEIKNSNGVAPPSAPPSKKLPKPGNEKEPEPYWPQLVETWFVFNEKNFAVRPSFADRDPKIFLSLVDRLKKRAVSKKIEWTQDNALASLNFFLTSAYDGDDWLRKHFSLKNLLEQFDSVYQRLSIKAAPKNQPAVPVITDQEIQYLLDRQAEGMLDKRVITEEHFMFLAQKNLVEVTGEIWHRARSWRLKSLSGSNQRSEQQLRQDYENNFETELTRQDFPRLQRMARRMAALQYFEENANKATI